MISRKGRIYRNQVQSKCTVLHQVFGINFKIFSIITFGIWKTLLYIFLVHRQSVYMFCFQTINIEVGFWYLLPVTSCWIDSYLSFVYLFRNVSSSQKHKIHKWLKVNISFDIKKKSINWTLSPTVKFIHQCF